MRADWAAWLADRADDVGRRAQQGDIGALWQMVRQASGKRRLTSALTAALQPDGTMASTPEDIAECWQHRFMKDFLGGGTVMTSADYQQFMEVALADREPPEGGSAIDQDKWVSLLTDSIAGMGSSKAVGPDCVPAEVFKASGHAFTRRLAEVADAAVAGHVPKDWRGGIMHAIPKKNKAALSIAN